MAVRTEERSVQRFRSLEAKKDRRERLRIRIPQAEDVVDLPPESESDSESEDEAEGIEDGEDSDDETEVEDPERVNPPPVDPPAAQPSAPGFVTLVPPASPTQAPEQPPSPTRISQPPAPPASEINEGPRLTLNPPVAEPSETDSPSGPVAPPESIVNSATEVQPTTFVSSTITNAPSGPSETSILPGEDDAESLISDTSLVSSATVEPTSVPSEDVEQVGASDGGGNGNRGTDVGIIIGTMALASLLIAACVLWYHRRRKKANQDHIARLDEKVLPPTPDGGETGENNRPQFNSWANFVRPNGEGNGAAGAAGYYAGNDNRTQPATPASPSRPPTAHGASGAFRSLTGQEPPPQMTSRYGGGPVEGRLVPPQTYLAPPPRTDAYPPR